MKENFNKIRYYKYHHTSKITLVFENEKYTLNFVNQSY